jgi:hypothetical protein
MRVNSYSTVGEGRLAGFWDRGETSLSGAGWASWERALFGQYKLVVARYSEPVFDLFMDENNFPVRGQDRTGIDPRYGRRARAFRSFIAVSLHEIPVVETGLGYSTLRLSRKCIFKFCLRHNGQEGGRLQTPCWDCLISIDL